MHTEEPEAANQPAEQVTQSFASALLELLFAVPAGHGVHAEAALLPVFALYVPVGHGVHATLCESAE